jgi:hypothetical protein
MAKTYEVLTVYGNRGIIQEMGGCPNRKGIAREVWLSPKGLLRYKTGGNSPEAVQIRSRPLKRRHMNTKKARQLRKIFLKEPSRLASIVGTLKWTGEIRKYKDEKKAYNRDKAVRDLYIKEAKCQRQ